MIPFLLIYIIVHKVTMVFPSALKDVISFGFCPLIDLLAVCVHQFIVSLDLFVFLIASVLLFIKPEACPCLFWFKND